MGCSPWGREESDTTERLHFHALEKEMAIHSNVLAWRIPGTGEPGGLPSMGSHRVGQTEVTQQQQQYILGASLVAQMVKASACSEGEPGSILGWGRSPGEGNDNPLQYSCLENSMDGGAS